MDQETEMRVWERVSGNGTTEMVPDLRGMELRCRESAAVLRQLASGAPGEMREKLQKLQREVHGDAMTLMGVRILMGEEPERGRIYEAGKIGMRRGLAQSFRHSRQARSDYLAHCKDGEYGPVFEIMAEEEGRRMTEILGLIAMAKV